MEDEIKLVVNDPMVLVKCMDAYFKTKTPDCSLYSQEGHEILVHSEVLYQTKWVVYFDFENFNFVSLIVPYSYQKFFPVMDFTSKKNSQTIHRIVASASLSRFEAHVGLFKLLMKGIFDPYVL